MVPAGSRGGTGFSGATLGPGNHLYADWQAAGSCRGIKGGRRPGAGIATGLRADGSGVQQNESAARVRTGVPQSARAVTASESARAVRVALLLIVMGVALAAQDLPPNLTELFNKGVQAEKAGRLD